MEHTFRLRPFTTFLFASAAALLLNACGSGSENNGGANTGNDSTGNDTPVMQTPAPQTLEQGYERYLTDMADLYILPSYQQLATRAQSLQSNANALCDQATVSQQDLAALKQQWQQTNRAWQQIQWLKLGPVLEQSRNLRLQFWLPGNQATANSVEALLLRQGEVINQQVIAETSVGAQGFPAVEYLLYREEHAQALLSASAQHCQVLTAITDNIAGMSQALHQAWQPSGDNYRQQLVSGTGDFRSLKDAIEELVTLWVEQVVVVKDNKIVASLGTQVPSQVNRSEYPLSAQSLPSLKANLDALQRVYTADTGFGLDQVLQQILEQQGIAEQLQQALTALITTAENLSTQQMTLATAISTEQGRADLSLLITQLNTLRDAISNELVSALDISIGFNSTDGD